MAKAMLPTGRGALRRRGREGKEGLALIELAIVLLLLLMITFGAMEYGWMFFQMHQVNNAARAGAREAVLPDSDAGTVSAAVESALGRAPDELAITGVDGGDWTETASGDLVRVAVGVNYDPLVGLVFLPTPDDLRANVAMAKEGPS